MYTIVSLLLVVLLSACATGAGDRSGGKEQVAAATAAWRAAYDSREPARITAMYDSDAVLWGTTAKTVAATPAAIAEYFKDAPKRPNARVAFGEQHNRVYGRSVSALGTTRFPTSETAKQYRDPLAIPWCSAIETDNGASSLIIHLLSLD